MNVLSTNNAGRSIPADLDNDDDWSDAELEFAFPSSPVAANPIPNPTSMYNNDRGRRGPTAPRQRQAA